MFANKLEARKRSGNYWSILEIAKDGQRERERGEREGGKDRHGGTDTPHVHRGSFKHAAFRVGTSDVSICRKSSMLA